MIIYQYALHLEVCLLAVLLIFELNKSVLQAVTSPLVSDDLAGNYCAEPTENQVEVFIC